MSSEKKQIKNNALGKGLASLFPGIAEPTRPEGTGAVAAGPATSVLSTGNQDRIPGIHLVALSDLETNPYQPRREFSDAELEELAQSIRTNGVIQPLVVRRLPKGGYQLIAGERRFRAAKRVGLSHVPVVVRKSSDRESLEIALIENIQRENLNCIDEALAYFRLMQEFQLTQEEVAHRVGKERVTVAQHLRLLKLPEAIIDDLKREILSFGHGKALLSLEDADLRLWARAQVIEKKMSVRQTEKLVEELKTRQKTEKAGVGSEAEQSPLSLRLDTLSKSLTKIYSTKVKIMGTAAKGKIVLQYHTSSELERLISLLQEKAGK